MSKECENCIKRKTMWCPTSIDCMALDELPYYLDKILALEKIDDLQQENKQLKELKYKFFDNCGDEESFTLEDYLEISNKLYDYEEENKQLKETIKEATRILNSAKNHYGNDGKNWALERVIRLLGDKENE